MSQTIAVVGSRWGADLDLVRRFADELWEKYPDATIVSGGADGVDREIERRWLEKGGRVISLRPVRLPDVKGEPTYAIERWELKGGNAGRVFQLIDHPHFADYGSACLYRDILVTSEVDRVVAFYRRGFSAGTSFTAAVARDNDLPVKEFQA